PPGGAEDRAALTDRGLRRAAAARGAPVFAPPASRTYTDCHRVVHARLPRRSPRGGTLAGMQIESPRPRTRARFAELARRAPGAGRAARPLSCRRPLTAGVG